MRVLIDTNVILDWLMHREPFHQHADAVLRACITGKLGGCLAAHTFSDLFYILRKDFDVPTRKELLLLLCNRFQIIIEDKPTIMTALQNENWDDLEDGLQMQCAIISKADYIITRDTGDFQASLIPAVSPEEFLDMQNILFAD